MKPSDGRVKDRLGIRLKKTCSSLTTVPEFVWINRRYPWKTSVLTGIRTDFLTPNIPEKKHV